MPVDASKYDKILVVGENATRNLMAGGGSSELKPKDIVTPLDGLKALYGDKIEYTQGYESGRPMYSHVDEIPAEITDSLRAKAVEMAREAGLVIFVGGLNKNHYQDCEDGDRQEYGLPSASPN